ncbi:MAG: hypothetical protein HQK51_05950 [Oligoflexia bacterium]|nr:hypothetical protein [Oligoflexia bacterium]
MNKQNIMLFIFFFICLTYHLPGYAEDSSGSSSFDFDFKDNSLQIGGFLRSEIYYYGNQHGKLSENTISAPQTASIYLDSKLRNGIRAFIRGKDIYDPTIDSTEENTQISPTTTESTRTGHTGERTGRTGRPNVENLLQLEEMKLMFNINKTVFITAGKSKIKWGVSKFWNPTDFINNYHQDILKTVDERLGVPLIKAHIPVDTSNIYLLTILEDSSTSAKAGYAARMEIPISTKSEFTLSALHRGGHKNYGGDFSIGVGNFDFYAEAAMVQESSDASRSTAYTLGASYEIGYADKESLIITGEYFHQSDGLSDAQNYTNYTYSFLTPSYRPFYHSRDYAMVSITMPRPFSWSDYTFNLFNLENISDQSYILKFRVESKAIQDILFATEVTYHYGHTYGEFRYGGQLLDLSLSAEVNF